MELGEIMRRIRLGDREALKELIARCGGGVYQRALSQTGDKALAKEITQKTFAELVTTLQNSSDSEGWQLWLDTLASRNMESCARLRSDVSYVKSELERELYEPAGAGGQAPAMRQPYAPRESYRGMPSDRPAAVRRTPPQQTRPQAQPHRPQQRAQEPERARSGFGYGFGVFVLVALCLILLWAAAGICMNMDFLPRIDLGYTWFNTQIFPFF